MIHPDDIAAWMAQVRQQPESAPGIIEALAARLVALAEDSAAEILDGLLADVDGHLAGRPAHDDITALVVKIQPASS